MTYSKHHLQLAVINVLRRQINIRFGGIGNRIRQDGSYLIRKQYIPPEVIPGFVFSHIIKPGRRVGGNTLLLPFFRSGKKRIARNIFGNLYLLKAKMLCQYRNNLAVLRPE